MKNFLKSLRKIVVKRKSKKKLEKMMKMKKMMNGRY